MAKQISVQDDLKELLFPYGGIHLVQPSYVSAPSTCADAENVRFFDPFTGRGRGGSRSGISKLDLEQVSGDHEIQHLATIVSVDGEMIDWSFDGPNQEFPGIYGGIGFIELDLQPLSPFQFPTIPDDGAGGDGLGGETFVGGSGYPPKPATKKTILEITVDPDEQSTGDAAVITFTLVDGDRSPFMLANKSVVLYTDPPGEVGDGFVTTVVGGSTQTDVTAQAPKKVYYYAEAISVHGAVVARTGRIHVRYYAVPTIIWANPLGIAQGTPLSSTQLNATAQDPISGAPIAGTFVYTPPSGTVLSSGSQSLNVTFTPTNQVDYVSSNKTVTIQVGGIVYISSQSNGGTAGSSHVPAQAVVAGDLIVVFGMSVQDVGSTGGWTVSDDLANSYTDIGEVTVDVGGIRASAYMAYAVASGSGSNGVIAAQSGVTVQRAAEVHVYRNAHASPYRNFSQNSENPSVGTTYSSGTVTAVATDLVAGIILTGTGGLAALNGFTKFTSAMSGYTSAVFHRLNVSGNIALQATGDSTQAYVAIAASFKAV